MSEKRVARVAFITLGCKVNQAESEAIAASIGVAGATTVTEADVVVINTCTVTAEADHKGRKAVRHTLALPLRPVVVVTGCLAALDTGALAALDERVIVEPDKTRVAARVREVLGKREVVGGAGKTHTRAQLKIEDGCDARCTYCIVPSVRGVPRAVAFDEVLAAAEGMAADGVPEVVLTGINIGRYEYEGKRLPDVVRAVASAGIARVRLSSVEPGDVTDELLAVAESAPAFCRHLHVPLQSGSDGVLHRMGRPYDTRAFARIVAAAREALPGLALSTDVIVGFPGETDAEFAETLAFVETCGFSRLHVFRYSERPGTPAASMPGQVPASVKAARSAELRALGERLGREYAQARLGTACELLAERLLEAPQGGMLAEGTTREYLRGTMPAGEGVRVGQLLRVRLEALRDDGSLRFGPVE